MQARRYHLMGIGGTGMSALAEILRAGGFEVSGCDLHLGSEAIPHLRSLGVSVFEGHDPGHVGLADVLVVSSAIPRDNPERLEAERLGVPVRHRAEALAGALSGRSLVAVAGAHGKTTTAALTAHMLVELGMDPMVAVGFALPGSPTGARPGRGGLAVVEADESDRSFLNFHPDIAVVTTIEPDHLENYGYSFDRLIDAYARFMAQVVPNGWWVLGTDSPVVRDLLNGRNGALPRLNAEGSRVVTYALGPHPARWTARGIELAARGSRFVAVRDEQVVGPVRLSVPGQHNVANALAVLGVADALGLDLEAACRSLEGFTGARRRFEVVAEAGGVMVVDDYAHHPTKIAATIAAARDGYGARVVAVFQPHRYHRTAILMDELAGAFDRADAVVLTDIYAPPPEQPLPGVTGLELFRRLAARPVWTARPDKAFFCPTLEETYERALAEAVPGTLVLVMGAGNITQLARRLGEAVRSRYGPGGPAGPGGRGSGG
ncbi:MAG: UDP-N-acetylmuramate--L-alanine ligase [Bacillota bacterium]